MNRRLTLNGRTKCALSFNADAHTGMTVENVRLLAQGSPFEGMYQPDDSKAFMEFDICNSYPNILGPVGMGPDVANYCCFFPDTLAASHESLRFQQLNFRHLLKAYGDDPKQKDANVIRNDRIIGCIVGTSFPNKPLTGWKTPGKPSGAEAKISCCAVVFKLAQGVAKIIGGHLANTEPQSVSIEVTTSFDNLGVYVPSRDELTPLTDPTEEIFSAYQLFKNSAMPKIGTLKTEAHPEGEQLLVSYGMNGKPVHFAGVGVTPNPAEKAAEIIRISAQGSNVIGIAAQSVFGALAGRKVTFSTGRQGIVETVHTKGRVSLLGGGFSRKGTESDPVLKIRLQDGARVLRHFSELAESLS